MHTGITSLLSLLEVKVSFSATYMGSSHTPNLASSDQNLWYSLYLLLALAEQGPALPISHERWFLNDAWFEEAVRASVVSPKNGGSSPSPSYPFKPNIIINFNIKSLYLLLLGLVLLLPPPLMPLGRLCEGPGGGMEVAAVGLLVVRIISYILTTTRYHLPDNIYLNPDAVRQILKVCYINLFQKISITKNFNFTILFA